MQFFDLAFILAAMTQPLALVVYEKLLPGSQLANRLRDLRYRVQTLGEVNALASCARQEKPLLAIVDLVWMHQDVCGAIRELRNDPETQHIPVIAFAPEGAKDLQRGAREAGATLVTADTTILPHLEQFLDQALQID